MNRRVKTESGTAKMVKRTRTTKKKLPPASTRRTPRKRLLRAPYTVKDSSSDDDFEFVVPIPKKNSDTVLASKSSLRNRTSSLGGIDSTPTVAMKKDKRKSAIPVNIYQISDSSDDEENNLSNAAANTDSQIINLCGTDDSVIECHNNVLDEVISAATSKKVDYSHPSTSKNEGVSSSSTSDIPDFVDNILHSNKQLLDEYCLKSMKDLHDETDKLLESSWNLINDTNNKDFEDSVIFCGEKETENKEPGKQNNIQESNEGATGLPNESENQKVKPQCPICLEQLGTEPVSSTICGHIFCTACIQSCITSLKKCPTCRKRLTTKMIHPLFLF